MYWQINFKNVRKLKLTFLLLACTVLLPLTCFGLNFPMPKGGDRVVGEVKTAVVHDGEDFSDVAERYDVGYYELFEANPNIDPDNPPTGTVLIISTRYIIPKELHENIVINLAEMRLYFQPKGEGRVYVFPVGIGKEDWDTPQGVMTIVKKVKDPKWVVPKNIYKFRKAIGDEVPKVVPAGPDNPLGSYELRTSNTDYLIHGTNLPAGVGRRSSAGCIRLYEGDIVQLYHLVEIGTPVVVINKPYKAGWLNGKLYFEAHMPLFEQRLEMGDDIKPAIDVISAETKGRGIYVDWKKVSEIAREHLVIPRALN